MDLPVIDLNRYGRPSASTLKELDAACRAHGFVMLKTGGGIEEALIEEAFLASKELFAMSDIEKSKMAQISPETNRGYSAMNAESLNHKRGFDMKEAFNLRFSKNDLRGTPTSFQIMTPKLLDAARNACKLYATACALALGLEEDHFAKHFRKMDSSTIRFLHYPPVSDESLVGYDDENDQTKRIRLGEHTDFGFFTHLYVEKSSTNGGLQLKPEAENIRTWRTVDTSAAQCIVNTGALAARWTNDIWAATAHRVIIPDIQTAKGHRYSMAIFFDPDADTLITTHPSFLQPGEISKYPPISSHDFLLSRLNAAQKPGTVLDLAAATREEENN
mmetsp:Transcript_12898/g.19322  ORF Transcript_12898/g.19322 Transcript_12898/m.19322 type:complete len:332 (-) Transcript_12898:187-1182(-)